MCGIAGIYYFNGQNEEDDLSLPISRSLRHRGPDAGNTYTNNRILLVHRRLSIIDPAERSNQPFVSASGRYVMVFNGEIYNFKEIARDLNIKTLTTSDTEVLLEAFEREGTAVTARLNGMFALVIYDTYTEELYLLRDRMGVKPLYYYQDENIFAFASEIKALLEIPRIKKSRSTDPLAVSAFLNLGYVPEPLSIYKKIRKFPSATIGTLSPRGLTCKKYWQLQPVKSQLAFQDSKEELKSLLESSVQYRLISDVPFGIFLSGGVDSSLVTAIAQKSSGASLKTFSMKLFEEERDESPFAKKVSEHLNTYHTEFTVSAKDIQDLIPLMPSVFDEPFADSSCFPTLMISSLARKSVTMALSGDGGDELFLGYGAYPWAQRLKQPLYRAFRYPIYKLLYAVGSNRYKRAAQLFNYPSAHFRSHVFSQEQYLFSRKEISDLLTHKVSFMNMKEESQSALVLKEMEKQAYFDLNYYLKDDLLVKVDRSSMRNSLEVREPLLDYRLVEYAYNLPQDFKHRGGISKFILKEVLYDYLPAGLFDRPKKGFSVPMNTWLKKDLRSLVETYVNGTFWEKWDLIKPGKAEELRKKFFGGHDYLYNRIWQLIVLGQWLEHDSKL